MLQRTLYVFIVGKTPNHWLSHTLVYTHFLPERFANSGILSFTLEAEESYFKLLWTQENAGSVSFAQHATTLISYLLTGVLSIFG